MFLFFFHLLNIIKNVLPCLCRKIQYWSVTYVVVISGFSICLYSCVILFTTCYCYYEALFDSLITSANPCSMFLLLLILEILVVPRLNYATRATRNNICISRTIDNDEPKNAFSVAIVLINGFISGWNECNVRFSRGIFRQHLSPHVKELYIS